MAKRGCCTWKVLAGALFLAVVAHAGVYYEAKTTGEGKGAEMQAAFVKAWVSGDQAKILFESSENPFAKSGSYLLTTDGGQTLYLVNPKEKTYSRWDMNAFMATATGLGQMMKLEISEGKVEKLEEKPGEVIAGLPTTYYKYRQTYRQKLRFMMMKQDNHVEQIHELWVAPKLVEKALGAYLQKMPRTPSEEFNKLLAMEYEKVQGVPLKSRIVTTTTNQKGATETQVVTTEVLTLQMTPVPDSTFALPPDFKEVELFPGDAESESPLGSFLGGKKKQ